MNILRKLYFPVTVHREQSVKKEYQQDATINHLYFCILLVFFLHTKKHFAPSWLYLQDYTGMNVQQNIQFAEYPFGIYFSDNFVVTRTANFKEDS